MAPVFQESYKFGDLAERHSKNLRYGIDRTYILEDWQS
jgi:hypothetical protein